MEIARLKETEKFRKEYLGNVAHELKTPIFNIQGYISTLLDGGLEDELINRKYLERTEKSIDRLINIVNDLDTISKLESDMTRLKMEPFDVVALTKEIADQLEMKAGERHIKLLVKGAEDLPSPFWVLADKHYVGQVMVNLLTNSICYGREGGQTRVRFRDMLDKILIEVEDSGVGIAKEDIPACLRTVLPHRQGPVTRTRRHGAGAGDRQTYRRSARRAYHAAQRSGRGQHLLLHAQEGGPERNQVNQFR